MSSWPYRLLTTILTITSLLVSAPATAAVGPPSLTSLTLKPTTVTGGGVVSITIAPTRSEAVGTVTLSGPVLSRGLAVGLSSNNTAVATVPTSVTVPAGATTANFPIQASPVASATSVTISASYGGVTKTAALTVVPPVLSSLTCTPTTVTGGTPVPCTVTLTGPAYSGGVNVDLSTSNPAVAGVLIPHVLLPLAKATLKVPAGQRDATFAVRSSPVTSATSVTISASYGGVTKTAMLTVVPPVLSSLSCTPTSVTGGTHANCTVTLTGPAYSGGANVTTDSSNGSVAQTHAGATVPAGATTTTFTVMTWPVTSSISVTISASFGGVTKTATLTILPPALSSLTCTPTSVTGGTPVNCTVTLTGPAYSGGVNVTLSSNKPSVATVPAPVTVPVGQTSASFAVQTNPVTSQTSVRIDASYGGVTKPATLTVNPAPKADLYIQTVTFWDSQGSGINAPQANQTFYMCVNVVNGGEATAGANKLRVELYQSGNPAQMINKWEKDVPQLNPHTGANVCVPPPPNLLQLAAGYSYDFNMYVDYYKVVDESNENNNFGHYGRSL